MLTAHEAGVETPNLLLGIGAALHYSNAEDLQSVELQQKISELGLEDAIKEVTGITDEKLVAEIVKAYNTIA
jgi:mannitol-1-phosphate 5-dehydrogenase